MDLFRIHVYFKNGEHLSVVWNLIQFENWYGNETREFYYVRMELVKESKT